MQAHPRDLGRDRRNLDPIVDFARLLPAPRHVRPTMTACVRQNVAPLRRMGMQEPESAGMRMLLLAALDELGRLFVALARRKTGIVRRLGRTILLGAQRGDLRPKLRHRPAQPINRLALRHRHANQRLPIQRLKGLTIHPNRESKTDSAVTSHPTRPKTNRG